MFKALSISLLSFLLFGCSVDEKVTSDQSSIEAFTVFDQDNLTQSSEEMVGSGRLTAVSTFKSSRVNAHFVTAGQFINEESSFTLHLFFDRFDRDTGIQLRFSILKPCWLNMPNP